MELATGILVYINPLLMFVLSFAPTGVLAGLFLFKTEQSLSAKWVSFNLSSFQRPFDSDLWHGSILYRFFYLPTLISALPNPEVDSLKAVWASIRTL